MTELDLLTPTLPEILISIAALLIPIAVLAAVVLLLLRLIRREKH